MLFGRLLLLVVRCVGLVLHVLYVVTRVGHGVADVIIGDVGGVDVHGVVATWVSVATAAVVGRGGAASLRILGVGAQLTELLHSLFGSRRSVVLSIDVAASLGYSSQSCERGGRGGSKFRLAVASPHSPHVSLSSGRAGCSPTVFSFVPSAKIKTLERNVR